MSGLAWAVAEIIVVKINLSPFSLESVEITGAKVSNKITDARFPGIVEYSYQLPRTNTKGEFIGGYKSVSTKTTYDPKILPDSKVADMSSRAAVQAESVFKANPALRETSMRLRRGLASLWVRDISTLLIRTGMILKSLMRSVSFWGKWRPQVFHCSTMFF